MSALPKPETSSSITPLEVKPLAHCMADAYWRALKAEAEGRIGGLRSVRYEKQQLLDASPANLEWRELSYVEQTEPGAGFEVYDHIKQAAWDDLESGQRAADVVASGIIRPWPRARYLALRESFIADWKPTGSMETRLIEMLAQLYTEYEHWMEISVQRAAVDCEQQRCQIKERGKWKAVTLTGEADLQQAADMADKFNRLFLRTLRQLVNLRRLAVPILINNPEQVNIATDGGQQANVVKKAKKKKVKARGAVTARGRRLQAVK